MATTTAPVPAAVAVEPQLNGHVNSLVEHPQFTCNLEVDYPTEELARIVMVTLSVDPELKPDTVKREMKVEGRRLVIKFTATEARFLRASFSSFMDLLALATRTIEEFGPGTNYLS
ncbi:unnamed protein product [Calypogeia fissa]